MIKSRRMRWAGNVARMGEMRNAYRLLVGKPEGKKPLGRPRQRWPDNIKTNFREMGRYDLDRIDLVQGTERWRALVNTVMNLPVPQNAGKFLSGCTTGGLSGRAKLHTATN
jgi:hypothetical protein